MAAMRVAIKKEGSGDGSESNGNGDTGGKHTTAMRAMAMVMATHRQLQRRRGWQVTTSTRVWAA